MHIKKNRNGGFTLIEFLISLSILIILTAAIMPAFTNVIQNTRMQHDSAKFESICVSFKSALTYPDIRKEIDDFAGGSDVTITCSISDDGTIVFGEGQIAGAVLTGSFGSTKLWAYAVQEVEHKYSVANKQLAGKSIVFIITPKTQSSIALCEYQIVDSD